MKKVITSIDAAKLEFDIEILLDIYPYNDLIAASEYKGYNFPDGELPPAKEGVKWSEQITEDYNAFLDTLELMLTEYYKFEVYYEKLSKDHSKYLGMVAKDSDGNLILKFNLNLRVSNHKAHRNEKSQFNKKEAKKALAKLTNGKRLRPTLLYVKVNDEEFDSYDEAVEYIDSQIERKLEFMRK